jgi:hypothetical protein
MLNCSGDQKDIQKELMKHKFFSGTMILFPRYSEVHLVRYWNSRYMEAKHPQQLNDVVSGCLATGLILQASVYRA